MVSILNCIILYNTYIMYSMVTRDGCLHFYSGGKTVLYYTILYSIIFTPWLLGTGACTSTLCWAATRRSTTARPRTTLAPSQSLSHSLFTVNHQFICFLPVYLSSNYIFIYLSAYLSFYSSINSSIHTSMGKSPIYIFFTCLSIF